ncbi:MAG: Acetyltransferase YpeA [Chloroflexi bacterium]|nr:Acetyltransferase YpeA [Chloroflexota bacterium]
MSIELYEMNIEDYDEIYQLWENSEHIGLSEADSHFGISKFLERNPGMSYVAWDGDKLIGAALCGQDGRRGYIHHLMVHPDYRRQGIGRSLVGRCMYSLTRIGIQKCHLFIFEDNEAGTAFWESLGWTPRVELTMMSHFLDE